MATKSQDVTPIFNSAAAMFNLDPLLPQAVAQVESGGESDPDQAVSSAGALGRMQVMPANLQHMNVQDPTDPNQNIYAGTSLLDQALTAAGGNVPLALRIYQGGPDQTKWGPNNAAYPAKVAAAYQSLLAKQGKPAAQPTAAPTAAPAASAPQPAPPADTTDDFLSGQANPAAAAPQDDTTDKFLSGADAPPPAAPAVYVAPSQPGVTDGSPEFTPQEPNSVAGMREVLAPKPNTTYGTILPLAKDDTTGNMRLALPSSLRDLGTGVLDLLAGPTTGQVTPAATNALVAGMTGGAGDAVANQLTGALPRAGSAALREGVSLIPGKSTYVDNAAAQAKIIADQQAMSELAANPFSANLLARQSPAGQIPAAPVNPLAAAPVGAPVNQAAASITTPNPLTGATSAVTPSAVGPSMPIPTALTAPPEAAVPSTLPAAPKIPPTSPAAVSNYADDIIRHFATPNALTGEKPGIAAMGDNQLLPGSRPSASQALADPGLAVLERGVRNADPTAFEQQDRINDAAQKDAINTVIGTPADIADATAAREASTADAKTAAFSNTTPVDASPVVEHIDSILAGPHGQRPGVAGPLQAIRDKLVQTDPATGAVTMQTDPEQLWGVRMSMNDMISPKAAGTASDGRQAAAQLGAIKGVLDPVIESGAPGFQNFLQGYSEASKPIDSMTYLQSLNLTDSNGAINPGKLDTAIKTLTRKQSANGVGAADSVTPDQIDALKSVQADMQREGNRSNLGKAYGSPTLQYAGVNNLMQGLASGKGMAIGAGLGTFGGVHYLGDALGVPGAVLGAGIASRVGARNAQSTSAVLAALKNKLADPGQVRNILAQGTGK